MSGKEYYILSPHFKKTKLIDVNIVGQKACYLLKTNPNLVPPFFILSSELFHIWYKKSESEARNLLEQAIAECLPFFEKIGIHNFIVRSSAKYESFDERGYYKSSIGDLQPLQLIEEIIQTWYSNIQMFEKFTDNKLAIVVQQYIQPRLSGHLSNERRISKRKNNFLYEVVDSDNKFIHKKTFKASDKTALEIRENGLLCKDDKELFSAIKKVGSYLLSDEMRHHVEWVWDIERLWLVQNDIEDETYIGTQPGALWEKAAITESRELKCFSLPTNCVKHWDKIDCIKLFADCNLPYGNVYILEQADTINKIAAGEFDSTLELDLNWLLHFPVVIRMDKQHSDGYSNILLPRTETLFDITSVKNFLITNSSKFIEQGVSADNFCFLIHRFIISKSCALAFAKPNIPQARIDSTWGIVDGLYYHPHDSFEVTIGKKITSKKKIRCKTEYLDVDKEGKWISKKAGTKWDWKESLSRKQLLDIANYTTKISLKLKKAVTVMYFIDIDVDTGYPAILPWFYTVDEIQDSNQKFTDIIFSLERKIIRNNDDFKRLKIETHDNVSAPRFTIKVKLNPELLREKELIEEIGKYAYESKQPIELEGSILSHTYYILRKTGATVKCIDPFNPTYESQEFYKLVRDKVPVNIELKGEKANTYEIDSTQLLGLLREKAVEEALEFFWETDKDKSIEELADLLEVINATCKLFNIDIETLQTIADNKRENKGGFEKGILLLETTESSLISIEETKSSNRKKPTLKTINLKLGKLKIHANAPHNSITLPYIIGGFHDIVKKDPKYLIELDKIQIEVHYSNKGINISFGKEKNQKNLGQLDLFNIE